MHSPRLRNIVAREAHRSRNPAARPCPAHTARTPRREVFAIQLRTRVAASEIGGADVSTLAYVTDEALHGVLAGALGLEPHEALTEKALAGLRALDLRGAGVAELTG